MAKSPGCVRVWEDSTLIPTSEEGLPDPNPPFDLFKTGRFHNYPYTLRHNLIDRRVPRRWRTLNLENEYLRCIILPDLGGHLYDCLDKVSGESAFYANPSLKFARVAYRGTWAACGIEFNFPVSHNWVTASPVDFAMTSEPDGSASLWVGNIDRVYGMQWRVRLTLHPGCAYLEQATTLYNRSNTRHRFYWWTNAAVEVWDDSRILYPMEFTAGHAFADVDTWPVNLAGVDQSIVGNHKYGPVSRFSYGSREPYMAVYHPRTQTGVVHYSSLTDLPAKKIWSWGCDEDGMEWRTALSDNNSAYVEIQAGLFPDQETYGFLEPQESRSFTEYWIPIRHLGGISRANLNAVLSLNRRAENPGKTAIEIALNVTRGFPNAVIRVLDSEREVAASRASLSPSETFQETFYVFPASTSYTIEVRNESGEILLQHTEGKYDLESRDRIRTGPQPLRVDSREAPVTDEDFLSLGTHQESNGELLAALQTYQLGLAQFPESIALNRAAGRLEVSLKQFTAAGQHLSKAITAVNNDHEAAYYLGLALAAEGRDQSARIQWEFAQQSRDCHAAARLELAALAARDGNHEHNLRLLRQLGDGHPELVKAGELEIALLRACAREDEARERLAFWKQKDPTCSFLRYEAMRLGASDPTLLAHLAADPERILEVVVDYMLVGLFEDALEVLSREYPSGSQTVSEPGILHPSSYPLIAYYRGFCNCALGRDGLRDFEAGSQMPISYVFPNRAESLPVLRRAIEVNPQDAAAHFLLGSLYLSGGMTRLAMEEWEAARRIMPAIPTLHRNMGYTMLRSGGALEQAIDLFCEGVKYDPGNADLILGLDEAMEGAGTPASERAHTIKGFPNLKSATSALVFRAVHLLGETEEFDVAEKLLMNRFFVKEEGGVDVREIYVTLKLKQAKAMAVRGECEAALNLVHRLAQPVAGLPFTASGLGRFVMSVPAQEAIKEIEAMCSRKPAT
jgi:tetratricopeptide (TPR) repeat protein